MLTSMLRMRGRAIEDVMCLAVSFLVLRRRIYWSQGAKSLISHTPTWSSVTASTLPRSSVHPYISPLHFQRGNIVHTLEVAMRKHQLDPGLLQIELTEGVIMNNTEETIATLSRLRALGFRVSIDDFGTGFSSLSYLQRMPINEVKIDRAFIAGVKYTESGLDTRTLAIPCAIIQLARNLGLQVVAEGVETAEQKMFLVDQGCDVVQGFLYSKPLTFDQYEGLMKSV
jgi:EAL domain-containing protein (putative c-di-GMP-specific phosphodiesterase class I)